MLPSLRPVIAEILTTTPTEPWVNYPAAFARRHFGAKTLAWCDAQEERPTQFEEDAIDKLEDARDVLHGVNTSKMKVADLRDLVEELAEALAR